SWRHVAASATEFRAHRGIVRSKARISTIRSPFIFGTLRALQCHALVVSESLDPSWRSAMPEAGGNLTNWPPSTFRGRIYDTIIDTIGATPLVRLARLAARHGVK